MPTVEESPTVAIWPTVGRAFGLGRSATYDAAAADTLPVRVLRVGGKLRAATAEVRRVLALDEIDVAS